ncbi:hypothetical protein GCM10027408_29620 [Microbacterium tumbae]
MCATLTIAAGLIVHRSVSGAVGDIAGDALYAVLIYLLAVLVLPRTSRTTLAALALLFCFGIELLQLTGVPTAAARAFPIAALVLGQGFDQRDLLVYAAAVVAVLCLDAAISRGFRRRPSA